MSNNDNTKKRRVGGSGARVSIDGAGESGGGSEMAAIKSMMQELVQQNHTQTNMINNMQAEITQLSKKCMSQNRTQTNMMQSIQGDIAQLTKKSDTMETTIKRLIGKSLNIQLDDMNLRFDKLEQTIEKKHIKLDDRLKYHEILLQNQKWEYSAHRPSAEYWSTLNGDEVGEAEDFLNHIKKSTEVMRYGTGNGEFEINANLSYNKELLPHWKEFTAALKQYHYHLKHSTELRVDSTLQLLDIKLPDEVVDLLSNAFESTHFQTIILRNNNFSQKGIEGVLNHLESNLTMIQFTLADNRINNMDDINKLCKIVKYHPSIKILELGNCKGMDVSGYEMLKTLMDAGKNKLSHIDLSNNDISTRGDTFISDFLAKSTILESLTLEGNQLNDNDAFMIVGALKDNENLRFLRLTDNNITKTGWAALRKAEFDNTSLNAAADSNNTCNMKYPSDGSDVIEGVDISEMNGDRNCENAFHPRFVRQKKVYSILSSRNRELSNVGHFEDIPVEILPDMLDSIQKYSTYRDGDSKLSQGPGDVNPLSIVYEVCRRWEESLAVFEALSS